MGTYSKLNRPIVVVAYDPRWPGLFAAERERLAPRLAGTGVEFEHIGSTAVPGLAAKPVIDIGLGLPDLPAAAGLIPILEQAGYTYEPALEAALPERRFLWRVSAEGQRYHLHLASVSSPVLVRPIVFRDDLRRHPEAAREYGRLKAGLAVQCGADMNAYVNGKTEFVERIMALALAEAALTS